MNSSVPLVCYLTGVFFSTTLADTRDSKNSTGFDTVSNKQYAIRLEPGTGPGGAYVSGGHGTMESSATTYGIGRWIMAPWNMNQKVVVESRSDWAPTTLPAVRMGPLRLETRHYMRQPPSRLPYRFYDRYYDGFTIDPMPGWTPPPGSKSFQFNGTEYYIVPLGQQGR